MNNHFKEPAVAIIILNWNGWEDTIECIESLCNIHYSNFEIIIVDNASEDESINKIREYCKGKIKVESLYFEYNPSNKPMCVLELSEDDLKNFKLPPTKLNSLYNQKTITILKNKKNYGFTEGNNIGMEYALKNLNPDYFLLLNNDTVVEPYFLNELIITASKSSEIGFVGPKIYFYEYDQKSNIIQYAGAKQNIWRFKPGPIGFKEEDFGRFDANKQVDFIHGSCMLVKSEMTDEIGLFDKEYFTFREENDWCMSGYKKGWISVYAYKSTIWHKGGRSTNSRETKRITWYYMTKNRFLFMNKHATFLQKISFVLYFFIIDFGFYIGAAIFYFKDLKLLKCFLKSVKDGTQLLLYN